MTIDTLFGLGAAALVGIGLYGLIVLPHPLRKIIAFNVMGSGVFLLFGALAKRGAAAGLLVSPALPAGLRAVRLGDAGPARDPRLQRTHPDGHQAG